MFLEILLAIIIGAIVSLILYARWNYGILESLGYPVVKPTFLLGSLPNLHSTVIHEQDIEFFKQHGPVYGVYEGRSPNLYVCDADLLKRIMVVDFDHFRDRRRIELGDEFFNEMLDFQEYEKWKVLRSQLMPAFSPAKYRRLKGGLKGSCDELLKTFEGICGHKGRGKINIRKDILTLNVDFTSLTLYGVRVPHPEDEENFLRKAAREMLGEDEEFNFLYTLSMTFPFLNMLAPTIKSESVDKFKEFVQHVIKERQKAGDPVGDDYVGHLTAMLNKVGTPEFKALKISEITVYAQAIVFFTAGYDTLTTGMVFLAHYLATYPAIQEKLLKEVDAYFKKHEDVDFDSLSELPYVSACVQEVLRLIPGFRMAERMCVKDFEYNGYKIKKGINVLVPLWAYHRNPDNFEDPEEFKPERFLPENMASSKPNPYCNATFGHGPRNCPGQRFALDVLKVITARIFKEFKFELRSDTTIKYKTGRLFMVQYDPIYLDIVRRNNVD